jgi:3-hydroxy-9,10-secoandrosta-1,3,5(10)-triene-9,17-dione monooxygenase
MAQTDALTEEPQSPAVPAPDELVERAQSLVPALLERAPLAEELRRLPDENVTAFKDAGFARMTTPTRFGGYGYGLGVMAEVAQPIGQACGASAWMYAFWPTHQHMVMWFSEEAQADYWADGPDTLSSTASAVVAWESTPVDGGLRVTGAHKFSSGIDHAEWVLLTSADENCLVPRSDFTIEDDWQVGGLKGTGSKTIRYHDIFIPSHRIVRHEAFAENTFPGRMLYPDDPFQQIPTPPGFVLPLGILAAVVATAGGVVEMFDKRARTRFDLLSMEPAHQRQIVQHRFAESAMEHDLALTLLRRNLAEMAAHPDMPLLERARIRRNTTYANHLCTRLVDRLIASGDASALYDANHVHRLARDVRAGALQFALGWDETAIQYSRVRWGLEPQTRLI